MSYDGQAQIRYRTPTGDVREWGVGAYPEQDSDETMRAHLHRWLPEMTYLGVCITDIQTGAVVLDTRIQPA